MDSLCLALSCTKDVCSVSNAKHKTTIITLTTSSVSANGKTDVSFYNLHVVLGSYISECVKTEECSLTVQADSCR